MTSPSDSPRDSAPAAANAAAEQILERDVPLSKSLIWKRQEEFYLQRGLKAWTEDQVPSYITNNPFIAEVYAQIVCAYVRDCSRLDKRESGPVPPTNPVRILELGAGSGKFSYLFLREVTRLLAGWGIDPAVVSYCMMDASEAVLDEWRRHDSLAEFVARGILQFEIFRAGEQIQSSFLAGARSHAQEPPRGPLVVIANYVFDSLPQDAFRIEAGRISEFLVTTSGSGLGLHAGLSSGAVPTSALKVSFREALVPPERYANPVWNRILNEYCARLSIAAPAKGTTVLFPCGALAALEAISRFGDGRMLVLAADKGFAHEDVLRLSQGPPTLEFHTDNCFSQLVNLDAVGKYFETLGGQALRPEKHLIAFNICGFLANRAEDAFPATETAYREAQGAFGVDDLFTLLAGLHAHMDEMTVPQILAVLRLTRWDTAALMRLFPALSRQLRTIVVERYDLREAVLRVWSNHYPVGPQDKEVAFYCGVILLELRFFDDAAAMFRASQKLLGPSAPTSYNLGLCAQGLNRPEEALAAMKEACALDPAFQPAQQALRKLANSDSQNS